MKDRNLDHKDDWETPSVFYNELNKEFNFDFDPCPFQHDTNKWNGLLIDWGECNFVNPPYSLKLKTAFVKKAIQESKKGSKSVLLLPVSTSTKLFHEYIKPNAKEIIFIKGRLKFKGINSKGQFVNYENPNEGMISFDGKEIPLHVKNQGMHDSMIVII